MHLLRLGALFLSMRRVPPRDSQAVPGDGDGPAAGGEEAEEGAVTAKNPRAKGNRLELAAKKELIAEGCQVEGQKSVIIWIPDKKRPGRRFPMSKRVDFFGVADIIAVSGRGRVRAIQVCEDSGGHAAARRRKFEVWCREKLKLGGDAPHEFDLELWRHKPRTRGFTKQVMLREGDWPQFENMRPEVSS